MNGYQFKRLIERSEHQTRKRWKQAAYDAHPFCWYCETMTPIESLTIDHINPIANGGQNNPSNYALSCVKCNVKKGPNPCGDVDMRLVVTKKQRKAIYAKASHA